LSPLLENHWPPSPAFEAATDENRDPWTLMERFGTSYEHARKVARELEKLRDGHLFNGPPRPVKKTIGQRLGRA
jgi:hypothetical protein